jgi:hypothetical protein
MEQYARNVKYKKRMNSTGETEQKVRQVAQNKHKWDNIRQIATASSLQDFKTFKMYRMLTATARC